MHQRTDSWPSWRLRSRVAVGSLGEYCVGGGINAGASAGTIGEIGTFFGCRLRGPAGEWARNIYPVAVLLGMFMQLQASLPAKPCPRFDEGRFPNPDFGMIQYRLVILPFADGGRSASHWIGLGSWKPTPPAERV